jgi:carbon monoxide dehydrogenase subunit G
MEMQASRTLAVSQQQAWEALNDPEVLKLCIPGCDKVEPTAENQYSVAMALNIVPPESYNIAFEGSGGVAGFGKGNAQVKLVPLPADAAGQASCELHYTVHASVGGKIAQLGQRLIDGAAKSMAEDFFKRFDEEMQRRFPRAEAPPADATATADAITQPGTVDGGSATQGGGIPAWMWGVGVAALVLLAWWFNRG